MTAEGLLMMNVMDTGPSLEMHSAQPVFKVEDDRFWSGQGGQGQAE